MNAIYRPTFVNQFASGPLGSFNCTMASAAMALDRHTLGKQTSTGGKMRLCQNDQLGGTDLSDAAVAWRRCYGETLDVAGIIAFADFVREVKQGRGAIITGIYGDLPLEYRHQYNFVGSHAMYVNELNAQGWLYNYDPIWNRPEWIPASIIKTFSGGFAGFNRIYCAFTKVTIVTTPVPPPSPGPQPDKDNNVMIAQGGLKTTSSHVMTLKKDTKIYKYPNGPVVTKMAKDGDVPYFGVAGSGWRSIRVATANPYSDKVARPTQLYVPASAGPVSKT